MLSCGIWLHVDLVRTVVSEELISSLFRVERISELGTVLEVTGKAVPNFLILSLLKM
jgi:hypothetical protein